MVEGSHKSYLLYIHTNFKRRFNGSELLDVRFVHVINDSILRIFNNSTSN